MHTCIYMQPRLTKFNDLELISEALVRLSKTVGGPQPCVYHTTESPAHVASLCSLMLPGECVFMQVFLQRAGGADARPGRSGTLEAESGLPGQQQDRWTCPAGACGCSMLQLWTSACGEAHHSVRGVRRDHLTKAPS